MRKVLVDSFLKDNRISRGDCGMVECDPLEIITTLNHFRFRHHNREVSQPDEETLVINSNLEEMTIVGNSEEISYIKAMLEGE